MRVTLLNFYSFLIFSCASGAETLAATNFDLVAGLEDESLQLLQLAAKKHHHTHISDGRCAMVGDTHSIASFTDGRVPDPQRHGLFTMADSKDGRFKSQLYQCAVQDRVDVGWINAMAYDIDGTRIVILPPLYSQLATVFRNNLPVYIRANDVEYTSLQLPFTIPGTTIEIRAHKPPTGFHIVTDGVDFGIEQESNIFFSYLSSTIHLSPDNIPDMDQNGVCVKGSAATPIADDAMDADWSVSLFTNADHDRICDYCHAYYQGSSATANLKCAKPPLLPPAPPAQTECEDNGCSWIHSQQLCHSLQGDDILYNDCLFDFCLKCDDGAAIQFVAELEDENPGPVCVSGAPECAPEEVCTNAVKMNTLTVNQNNLGGVGPDSGAEEIRYSNAAVVDGRSVDLVLTTDGDFKSSKPSKNGNTGAFGVLNVKCGTSVTVTMQVVDSETGAPVILDAVALTWYDLDEGKKQKGRATVTTCGSTGAIVSENSELTLVREGDCSSASSSVAGTGKDNPKSPHQLDSVQISRAVTLPFKQVSQFGSTLALAKGHKGRNFLFAIEPSVACGL